MNVGHVKTTFLPSFFIVVRVRITTFGSEVGLYERCSDTKLDVTGYFCSPASRHFINYFSKILGPISPERLDINKPNLNRRL